MGKKKRIKRERQAKEINARKRAEVILQVRAGQITATDGAAELGVSRKTFYQWEDRALSALAASLEDKDPGRPGPDPKDVKIAALEEEVASLKKAMEMEKHRFQLREELHKIEVAVVAGTTKKKSGGKNGPGTDHPL